MQKIIENSCSIICTCKNSVVYLLHQIGDKPPDVKLNTMNAYEFTNNLKKEFGSNLNIIYMNEKGCTIEVHAGRMIKTDLAGKKHKYYTSVDRLMKF